MTPTVEILARELHEAHRKAHHTRHARMIETWDELNPDEQRELLLQAQYLLKRFVIEYPPECIVDQCGVVSEELGVENSTPQTPNSKLEETCQCDESCEGCPDEQKCCEEPETGDHPDAPKPNGLCLVVNGKVNGAIDLLKTLESQGHRIIELEGVIEGMERAAKIYHHWGTPLEEAKSA